MEQINRIRLMEECLDESRNAVDRLNAALDSYFAVRSKYMALVEYYDDGQWRRDFDDDEAGKLPPDLKRGVLSEDAVWNLIEDHRAALERMKEILSNEE